MNLAERLRDKVNALMAARGWTSNRQLIEASQKRLTNGTLGRLRSQEGENVRLTVLEDLSQAFGVEPWELLAAPTDPAERAPMVGEPDWRTIARTLASLHPHQAKRVELLDFCRRVDLEYADQLQATRLPGKFTTQDK